MKSGFTIIEVIVAIGIFGFGVLAVLTYFVLSTQFVRLARQTTMASNLAQQVMEENIALSYDSLLPGQSAKTPFSADSENPYSFYQYQTNISLIDSTLNNSANDAGLKKVDVTVFWNALQDEKSVHLSTVVTEK